MSRLSIRVGLLISAATGLLAQGRSKFYICSAVAVGADLTIVAGTDGLAGPAVEASLNTELKFCWRMAFKEAATNIGVCMGAAVPLAFTACAFIVSGHG